MPRMHLSSRPAPAWKAGLLGLATALSLAACGGGSGNSNLALTAAAAGSSTTATPPTTTGSSTPPATPGTNAGRSGPKVLLVQVDGMTYAALRQAQAAGALTSLRAAPAWTGGIAGTPSAQPTTTGPAFATLLTGTWARHGVAFDSADQRIDTARTPTLLAQLRQRTQPFALQSGVVTSSTVAASLSADPAVAAAIDRRVDCNGDDGCVTTRTRQLIEAGIDLTVAEYGAPARAATDGLGSAGYRASVTATAAAVQQLLDTIAHRQANDPKEDWLVLLTADHGLDAFGSTTGSQSLDDKTSFVASNKALPSLPAVNDAPPADIATLLQAVAATDLAPTVLQHLGMLPALEQRSYDGIALQAGTAVRQLRAVAGADKASLVLGWTMAGNTQVPVKVYRDGTLIATLPAASTRYTDNIQAAADGLYAYRYTVVAGDSATGVQAQIAYVKPALLATTLVQGLAAYYPLNALPTIDAIGASTMAPWASDAAAGSLVSDDPFVAPYKGKALRVDSTIRNASGMSGYRLLQGTDVATDSSVTAYTLGFWLRTDASCSQGVSNGGTVIGNKNYTTGANAGLAIGLFGGCEIRFNVGAGGSRADSNGYKLSAGQWAYVAVVIDKANLRMTGYVLDPALGTQTGSATLTSTLVAQLGGLKNGIGLNEDGTGLYYQRETSSPRGAMDFDDVAIWRRALTADEIASMFKAAQPLSTLPR
ncbi:hypothetical protein ABIC63_002441 [Pseudacidovorax sp. 1753]|uniref:LamG domain-containing protein n=1 Tax=Pseudacidovorax sp. 1753 TaxID=3156419 RepID=UPI0033944910